jgi:hypothetical protein
MNKKILIIGGGILGLILIGVSWLVLRGNSQSSGTNNTPVDISDNTARIDTAEIVTDKGSFISQELKQRLNLTTKTPFTQYHYSPLLKLAFTYENQFIGNKSDLITVEETEDMIFVYPASQSRDKADSIRIFSETNLSSIEVPAIIQDSLAPEYRESCSPRVNTSKSQANTQIYELVSEDNSDCGLSSREYFALISNNTNTVRRLFQITPQSNPITFDGSNRGQYWYQSIIIE